MEAVLEIIGSMNLPIHKPTKQSMKEYVEGIIREARNFSVLRVSEFLNFSYQRLQYLVSEARFRDTELEQTRLQWAVSQSSQQQKGPEFDLVIDDTQNRRFVRTYFASKCYIGNIGKVDIAQSTVFSSL
ncbi:MAG: transposase, partial [Ignavibacteriales bacterium]